MICDSYVYLLYLGIISLLLHWKKRTLETGLIQLMLLDLSFLKSIIKL